MLHTLTNPYALAYLKKHGYGTEEAIGELLGFAEEDLRDVRCMEDGERVLARLAAAVEAQEPVTIYGDYDADGIMASFILFCALDTLIPGKIRIFINDRFADGYSMTPDSMEKLLARYPETALIISCDNGVGAGDAIALAAERGVDVLVTDHHEQGQALSAECPVLDEKSLAQKRADEAAGIRREDFCGAELARRVATALYEDLGIEEDHRDLLNELYGYAGFATITDSVPMRPANHYVARRGLEVMRGEGLPWRLLKEECRLMRPVDSGTVGFTYGPMFNAGGRVTGSAVPTLKVLYAAYKKNETACRAAIREIAELNETRKEMSRQDDARALELIRRNKMENDPFLFLYDDDFAEGINGLTAAHMSEQFRVPAAVLSPTHTDPDVFKGSARSHPWFDLFREMSAHPDVITAGGHPMAAGLRVRREDLEEARRLLCLDAARARSEAPEETLEEDAPDFSLTPVDLSVAKVESLQEAYALLEPFGPELPQPTVELSFSMERLFALRGKDGTDSHAKFRVQEGAGDGSRIEVLWWNRIEEARALTEKTARLTGRGRPELNIFRGETTIQFVADTIDA